MTLDKTKKSLLTGTANASYRLPARPISKDQSPSMNPTLECRVKPQDLRLSSNERGLIISSPIEVEGSGILLKSSDLDSQELRSNLLFWDRFDCPSNNFIHISSVGSDADFLSQEGILVRSEGFISGSGNGANAIRLAHTETFKHRDQIEPGMWSISHGINSIAFKNEDMDSTGILFQLHKCLLVPDHDVPIQEVLHFKSTRKDELLALRHHLSDVYQKILAAPDQDLAYCVEIERLEKALVDEIKVAKESKLPFRLTDIKAKIDYGKLASGIIVGWGASQLGFPIIPALLAGAASGVSIEQDVTVRLKNSRKSPYEYITLYHDELF